MYFYFIILIIFRPHILQMGEENHDLWRVFFQILPKLHLVISIHLTIYPIDSD